MTYDATDEILRRTDIYSAHDTVRDVVGEDIDQITAGDHVSGGKVFESLVWTVT